MNRISLLTQVAMIVVAVVIFIMYIQPKVSSIRLVQDVTANYVAETEKVSLVNESLKAKIATIESIKPEDTQALNRFMPDAIDQIAVLKDLSNIITAGSVNSFDVAYIGNTAVQADAEEVSVIDQKVIKHTFTITFESNYTQLKSVLELLETNDYLLEISTMKVTAGEEGLLKVDMGITTFTRNLVVPEIILDQR